MTKTTELTISYKRTFNLGNYESETIGLSTTIELNDSDNYIIVAKKRLELLKAFVHGYSVDELEENGGR